jgi:hypothetical protein
MMGATRSLPLRWWVSVGILCASMTLVLPACAPLPTGFEAEPGQSRVVESVRVETGDVLPVTTLSGDVRGPVSFQITADISGTLVQGPQGGLKIEDDSGEAHSIIELNQVTYSPILPIGSRVTVGLPVADATFGGFALVAPIEGADLVRMASAPDKVRAQVDGAGAPFACELLDDRPSLEPAAESGRGAFVACAVPAEQRVIVGMSGLVALQFDVRNDVLTLPLEAVAGSIESGLVYVKRGSDAVETKVQLGVADSLRIEIRSGLSEGDEVYIPSPALLNG